MGVRYGVGEIVRGCLVDVSDDGAVDVDADRAVRCAVRSGDQVGPGGGEVEHLYLIDLPLVEAELDRFGRPLPELGVPERTVGIGVPRVAQRGEVAEHVEQVTALP